MVHKCPFCEYREHWLWRWFGYTLLSHAFQRHTVGHRCFCGWGIWFDFFECEPLQEFKRHLHHCGGLEQHATDYLMGVGVDKEEEL